MKKTFGIVIGALIVVVGVLYALDSLNLMRFNISLDGWWTVFIIAPSFYGLIMRKDKTGNLIGLSIGVLLLLAARDIITYDVLWQLFIPALIILIGIKFIIKAIRGEDDSSENQTDSKNTECDAIFTSKSNVCSGSEVKTAHVCAVFGGTKCNFSDAKFDRNSKIDLFCIFGGADLIIPSYVDVKVNSLCIFGGISDKRVINGNVEKTASLTINGLCLFGGADIK